MKKIGILGSGIVAQTLGSGFIKHGFSVMLGTRDTNKLKIWQLENGTNAFIGNFKETANYTNTLVLAVKGTIAKNLVRELGNALENKIIIDTTNPIADVAPINGVLKFFTNLDESLMEVLQQAAPKAYFVKAFNSIGSALMVNPSFKSKPTMFICGNNEQAKKQVTQIIDLFGFDTEDMGAIEAARAIEPLCMLWCIPGFRENRWSHAFKLLK